MRTIILFSLFVFVGCTEYALCKEGNTKRKWDEYPMMNILALPKLSDYVSKANAYLTVTMAGTTDKRAVVYAEELGNYSRSCLRAMRFEVDREGNVFSRLSANDDKNHTNIGNIFKSSSSTPGEGRCMYLPRRKNNKLQHFVEICIKKTKHYQQELIGAGEHKEKFIIAVDAVYDDYVSCATRMVGDHTISALSHFKVNFNGRISVMQPTVSGDNDYVFVMDAKEQFGGFKPDPNFGIKVRKVVDIASVKQDGKQFIEERGSITLKKRPFVIEIQQKYIPGVFINISLSEKNFDRIRRGWRICDVFHGSTIKPYDPHSADHLTISNSVINEVKWLSNKNQSEGMESRSTLLIKIDDIALGEKKLTIKELNHSKMYILVFTKSDDDTVNIAARRCIDFVRHKTAHNKIEGARADLKNESSSAGGVAPRDGTD